MAIDRFYAVGFVIAILFSLGLGQNQSFGPKQNTKFGVLSTHHHQKLLGGF